MNLDLEELERIYETSNPSLELLMKTIKYSLVLTSWMGARAKSGRRMPKYKWYLLLDDKGKGGVRTFYLDGYPIKETVMGAYEEDRVNRKWLSYSGKTKPDTKFNPNKKILGEYKVMDTGSVGYDREVVNGEEQLLFSFKGKILKGKWTLLQEEKGADTYTFEKIGKEKLTLSKGKFVLDRHEFPIDNGIHIDLRWYMQSLPFTEINLYESPIGKKEEESIRAVKKTCNDIEWMKVKPKGTKMKSYGKWGRVDTIDNGSIEVIEENPYFISMNIKGNKLKGYYILKKDNPWVFMKSTIAKPKQSKLQQEGNPRNKSYKKFIIEERKGWDYFIIRLYDLRKFTRVESQEKTKGYFPKLDIPSGVTIAIGLYSRIGKLHGTRIVYVRFTKEKWDYKRAEGWIRSNNLERWEGTQIRTKKELSLEQFRVWIRINKIDVPGREIHCNILTPSGKEEAIFGVFMDDIIQDLLDKFRKGENVFLVRVFRGFIIQILSSTRKEGLYGR